MPSSVDERDKRQGGFKAHVEVRDLLLRKVIRWSTGLKYPKGLGVSSDSATADWVGELHVDTWLDDFETAASRGCFISSVSRADRKRFRDEFATSLELLAKKKRSQLLTEQALSRGASADQVEAASILPPYVTVGPSYPGSTSSLLNPGVVPVLLAEDLVLVWNRLVTYLEDRGPSGRGRGPRKVGLVNPDAAGDFTYQSVHHWSTGTTPTRGYTMCKYPHNVASATMLLRWGQHWLKKIAKFGFYNPKGADHNEYMTHPMEFI